MRARVLDAAAPPNHQRQLSDGQALSGDGGFSGSLGLQLNESVPSTSNPIKSGQEDPWSKHMPLSDISRTPSQSTTATSKSSNSLETAASSLQSGPSSSTDIKGDEQEHLRDDVPLHSFGPVASASTSPAQYVTACPSPEDENFQRRETDELRRYHALHELVETERTYAEDLYILQAIFLANLPNQAYFEESEERVRVVTRNATQLLELHSKLSQAWDAIMSEQGVNLHNDGSIDTKAARCGEAIRQIASCLTRFVRLFREYRFFCSRHAEALVVIREAERRHNGDDFAAYERTCGNMVRARFRSPTMSVRPKSSIHIASTSVPSTPSTATINMNVDKTLLSVAPSSGTTTPGDSFASLSVQRSSSKLVFADYLIKPVQRLCLYPLVLNALMKYTPIHESTTRDALQLAIDAMRNIADEVDEASRVREKDLMAQLTLSRIEPVGDLSYAFLKSLGPPQLSGTLDVLHHHSVEEPLTSPLRFHHMGVIMWANYIVFVRTRKNRQLECRFWFPLEDAIVTPKDGIKEKSERDHAEKDETTLATLELAGRPLLPFAFRMTFRQSHHFELSASHESEFRMWYDALRFACLQAKKQLPSLPDEANKSRQDQAQDQKQQRYACSLSSDNGQSSGGALLSEYLAVNLKQPLVSSLDNLIKLPSVTARNAIDRSMIFSDLLVAPVGVVGVPTTMIGGASALREISEALVAQQLRQNAAPSIGSAVGAAMGLAKMAATQKMPTVKRPRKMSSNIWQGDLTPLSMVNVAGHEGDAASVSPASDERSTAKRVSLRNLRMSSTHGNYVNNQTGTTPVGDGSSSSSRRLSSPVIATFGARMRGSIMRANSRTGHSTPSSVAGSLPTSPNGSALDLTETISRTSGGDSESDTLRPSHQRSKSNALREVWSSTIAARRVRSKSAQSVFTMGPPYGGSVLANGELHSSPTSLEPPATSVNGSLESLHQSPLSFETLRSENATLPSFRGHRMPSAPASGRSSRRQSIVSLLSLSNFDQGSSSPPMPRSNHSSRPSSPALNILQVREGAAAKLKHAKSAVRNRLSMSSSSTSSMAKPLATSTTAQGWMSHTTAFAARDEIVEEMADSKDGQLAPAASSTASSSSSSSSETDARKERRDLKRSATIADRLRGSLSRKSSLLRLQSLSLEARRSETNLSERFNRAVEVAPADAATEADVVDEMNDKYDDAYLPTLQETLSAENSHDAA